VRPLVPRGAAGGACCLLLVENPEEQVMPPERRLIDIWGLTEAEARVAALLAAGHAPREAADKLGISFNTVRTHLQRIFAKTDTARQGELIGLLTRLGIAMGDE
jgi:DNA-binding CsgD family transcriptional regulator